VILGAGLDTRAVRKRSSGVTYFEIDDAPTLNIKQACYQHHGFDVNVKFIAGNYMVDGTIDLLEQNGFDCGLPSYFIWEGNTMYLPIDGTRKVLAELRSHVKRFRVSFDYMAESVISKTTGDPGITTLVESFANMGAPWLSGIKDVKGLAWDLGLDVVENFRMAELHQAYGVTRPMSSPIFNYYAVCTLGHESASRRQAA